jgi:hypothetical protein
MDKEKLAVGAAAAVLTRDHHRFHYVTPGN